MKKRFSPVVLAVGIFCFSLFAQADALREAVIRGSLADVKLAIAHGADVNAADSEGEG
jgi:hypothetical protein